MVFSSPVFLFLFLPILLGLYFFFPRAWRNSLLLFASLLFYAWGESKFVVVLLFSVLLNHFCGRLIQISGKSPRGKQVLVLAVTVNVMVLIIFKYSAFLINDVIAPILQATGRQSITVQPLSLPIGISFFTFQAISYLVDIYRGTAQAQQYFGTSALYITFFPQLIAGPIVRYKDVATQFVKRTVCLDDFAVGVKRFIIGLGKKMLIANTVAITVDQIFALPANQLTMPVAWLGITCYTLQIYFDFSGYSDMAIGLAQMFGFRFLENFNYPYISQSVQEFWRRWHISLSSWFRDYLYIPLGGNQVSTGRTYGNLLVIFFLCGLWHGASWTFIVWGLFHGAFLALERAGLGAKLAGWSRFFRHTYTLLIVMMGWVLFRAETLSSAGAYIAAMFGFSRIDDLQISANSYLSPGLVLVMIVGFIGSTPILPYLLSSYRPQWIERRRIESNLVSSASVAMEVISIFLILVLSLIQAAADTYNPFIYFRF